VEQPPVGHPSPTAHRGVHSRLIELVSHTSQRLNGPWQAIGAVRRSQSDSALLPTPTRICGVPWGAEKPGGAASTVLRMCSAIFSAASSRLASWTASAVATPACWLCFLT